MRKGACKSVYSEIQTQLPILFLAIPYTVMHMKSMCSQLRHTRLYIDNQYARLCALANCFPRCVFAWGTLGAPCLVRRHRKYSCYSAVCWITMCTPSFSGVNRKFIPYKESPNLTAMFGFRRIHEQVRSCMLPRRFGGSICSWSK